MVKALIRRSLRAHILGDDVPHNFYKLRLLIDSDEVLRQQYNQTAQWMVDELGISIAQAVECMETIMREELGVK